MLGYYICLFIYLNYFRNDQSIQYILQYINEEIGSIIRSLKEQDGSNIWLVGGGELQDTLLKEKLVDDFIVTINHTS